MSKITNDDLTRYGTGCFIVVPIWQQGRERVNEYYHPVFHYQIFCLIASPIFYHIMDNMPAYTRCPCHRQATRYYVAPASGVS